MVKEKKSPSILLSIKSVPSLLIFLRTRVSASMSLKLKPASNACPLIDPKKTSPIETRAKILESIFRSHHEVNPLGAASLTDVIEPLLKRNILDNNEISF